MNEAITGDGTLKEGNTAIDRNVLESTSDAMIAITISEICNTLSKISPGSEYKIKNGIIVSSVSKSLLGLFVSIIRKRSDQFNVAIWDSHILLKLNKSVNEKDSLLTWVRLQEVIAMHYQLLDMPDLLDNLDFVDKELFS